VGCGRKISILSFSFLGKKTLRKKKIVLWFEKLDVLPGEQEASAKTCFVEAREVFLI
jgi:hypothetical protein